MHHSVKPVSARVLGIKKKLIIQLNSNEENDVLLTNNKYSVISTLLMINVCSGYFPNLTSSSVPTYSCRKRSSDS